jgi:hypothetical protein
VDVVSNVMESPHTRSSLLLNLLSPAYICVKMKKLYSAHIYPKNAHGYCRI